MDGGEDSDDEEDVPTYAQRLDRGLLLPETSASRHATVMVGAPAMRVALSQLREAGAYGPGRPAGPSESQTAPDTPGPTASEGELLAAVEQSCRASKWPMVFFGFLSAHVGVGLPHLWPPMREPGLAPVRMYDPRMKGQETGGPAGGDEAGGVDGGEPSEQLGMRGHRRLVQQLRESARTCHGRLGPGP